jgi:hypothetical protein
MKLKRLIGILLLVFACGSLVYMALRETRRGGGEAADQAVIDDTAQQPRVVVYFFDSDKECTTCEQLEVYAYEALEMHFADELGSGELMWQRLNTDDPVNEHFVMDYGLYSKSVVVVEFDNGAEVRWKNLEEIWELVYDKPAYIEYIRENTQQFLGGTS